MSDTEAALAELLARGLDLCVRARKMDDPIEWLPVGHPENDCKHAIQRMRCVTPHLWLINQYDEDLKEWETTSKEFLVKHGLAK